MRATRKAALDAYYDAHNAHDPVAVAALYTPEGVHEDAAFGHSRAGHAALQAGLEGFFAMFAGMRFTERERIYAGDSAVVIYSFSGRATRNIGPLKLAGLDVTLSGVHLLEFSGDRIARSRDYWDPADLEKYAAI